MFAETRLDAFDHRIAFDPAETTAKEFHNPRIGIH